MSKVITREASELLLRPCVWPPRILCEGEVYSWHHECRDGTIDNELEYVEYRNGDNILRVFND